jgi:hypothetical protein
MKILTISNAGWISEYYSGIFAQFTGLQDTRALSQNTGHANSISGTAILGVDTLYM